MFSMWKYMYIYHFTTKPQQKADVVLFYCLLRRVVSLTAMRPIKMGSRFSHAATLDVLPGLVSTLKVAVIRNQIGSGQLLASLGHLA